VSSEGACAAYYLYGRHLEAQRKSNPRVLSPGGAAVVSITALP
jgi:hypothetical protein